MRNLMKKGGVAVLGLSLLAGFGYSLASTIRARRSEAAAATIAHHDPNCLVCRLPLHGQAGSGSQLGPQARTDTGPTALLR